ncbi:Ca-activated chloride channel family protein [Melghirimyces profundicolus]|uniref:Ca-activated chloride channel family protein n=2 Tax=Melghirimyces profundicolus TaxID=1242148 RepID=A0A2T6BPV5_9BACL|nr:Ca-activated chloride channel family protein [Melghirimyces profundicolus]
MLLAFTTGCGLLTESGSQSVKKAEADPSAEQKKPDYSGLKIPEQLKSLDIMKGPGEYGGTSYDLKKIRPQLDKISAAISPDQLEARLIQMMGEDYRRHIKKYQDFDTSVIDIEAGPGSVKNIQVPEGQEVNIVILLDASGSMADKVDGGVKMDLAKSSVQDFVSNMPEGAHISLQVYGHKGSNSKSDKQISCNSIEEIYPLGAYDQTRFQSSLKSLKPAGWTPLAGAIQKAEKTLAGHTGDNTQNVVYVVSDGIETCDGDPVAAADKLHHSNIQAVVNIIGFDVDNEGQQALLEVANAGGGEYQTVKSKVDLEAYFEGEFKRLYDEWQKWAEVHEEKASIIAAHKLDHLDINHEDMKRLVEWEYNHFKDALTYLKEERKFEYELISEVESRIYERKEALSDYSYETKEQLQTEVQNNRDNLQDHVRNKRDEEQEKLNN